MIRDCDLEIIGFAVELGGAEPLRVFKLDEAAGGDAPPLRVY